MIKGLKATLFAGVFAIGASAFAAAPVITLPANIVVQDDGTGEFVNNELNLSGAASATVDSWTYVQDGTAQYEVNGQPSGSALVEGPLTVRNVVLSATGGNQPFPANEADTIRTLTFTATNGDGSGNAEVDVITANPNASASFAFSVNTTTGYIGDVATLVATVTNNSGADFTEQSIVNFNINPADGAFFSGYTVNGIAAAGFKAVDVAVGPLANGASATIEQSIVLAKAGAVSVSGTAIVEGTAETQSAVIDVKFTDEDPSGANGYNFTGTAAVAAKNGVKYNAKKDNTNIKIELLTGVEGATPADFPAKGEKWKFTADAYLLDEPFVSPDQLTASALKKPITLKGVKAKKFTVQGKKNVAIKKVPGNASGKYVVIKLYTFDKKTNTFDHMNETNIHDNYIVVQIP